MPLDEKRMSSRNKEVLRALERLVKKAETVERKQMSQLRIDVFKRREEDYQRSHDQLMDLGGSAEALALRRAWSTEHSCPKCANRNTADEPWVICKSAALMKALTKAHAEIVELEDEEAKEEEADA